MRTAEVADGGLGMSASEMGTDPERDRSARRAETYLCCALDVLRVAADEAGLLVLAVVGHFVDCFGSMLVLCSWVTDQR